MATLPAHGNKIGLNSPTASDIEHMSYTDFIAFLKETNRCPGGKKTIRRIREVVHIDHKSKILDVGCNTGFTSLEFAHITPAHVFGIDISEACVVESNQSLQEEVEDVQSRVTFKIGSAYNIPYPDNEFNVVMVGGATSFMIDKGRAIEEYFRVLKPWGFLASSPLTYHTKPPAKVVEDVSAVLGVKITPMNADDWIEIVHKSHGEFELYINESHTLSPRTDKELERYVDYFLNKDHISTMSQEVKDATKQKWLKILKVFNENHKYLGYNILVFRKRATPEEPELFISA